MRTTTSGRAFTKDMIDLFSTLLTTIRIENRKIRFRSYPNTFLAEDAIAKLGSLQSNRSVLETDPNDPTRLITQVVTSHLSFTRDMAKNICQSFMDARLIESATDPTKREFQPKGLCQLTPKGAHLLSKFLIRNKMNNEDTKNTTANAIANLVHLDRADDEDAIILGQDHVDAIFKRFAGNTPNRMSAESFRESQIPQGSGGRERTISTSADLSNGIEVGDYSFNNETKKNTFYGRAAVEWLMDCSTVISKEEAFCICQEMVSAGYIELVGEENSGGRSLFKTGNSALYQLTDRGRKLAGWTQDDSGSINKDWTEDKAASASKVARNTQESALLSTQFKLTVGNVSRLPISIRDQPKSSDEGSVTSSPNSDETGKSSRRLSQILNDPSFQIALAEGGPMSSYAASSSGRESVSGKGGSGSSSGGSRKKTYTPSSVQSTTSNTSRLNGILFDSTVKELFKSFLKQNFCEENLSFYLEVNDYKLGFASLIDSAKAYNQSVFGYEGGNNNHTYPPSLREREKQICTQAFSIYETYLVSGASREVNLPHQMRQDITSYMQAIVRNMESHDPNSTNAVETSEREKSTNGANKATKELIHIGLFNLAHDHIFRLMSTDSVPKFIKTDKYLEVVMSKHKRKNASSNSSGSSTPASQEANGGRTNGGGSGGYGKDDLTSSPGSSRNEETSLLRRSVSFTDRHHYNVIENLESTIDSRSDSGQSSPRNGSATSSTSSTLTNLSQAAASVSNSSIQNLRIPRTRTASTNSGVFDTMQQQRAAAPTIKPKPNNQRQPASLLDIYAQQQHLQQYSNQRAQLSPAQVQQMYMARNSKSSTSLPLTPTTPPTPSPSFPSQPDVVSSEVSTASAQNVSVIFESTSIPVDDMNTYRTKVAANDSISVQTSNQSPTENKETLPGSYPINGNNKYDPSYMDSISATTNDISLREM